MFEMLGNQYFMVRNYLRAAEMLTKALQREEQDKAIRRKLIICYTQLGEVEKALELFLALIREDINFIVNIDPVEDDCPCPDIVEFMEQVRSQNRSSLDFNITMGILYLYCNLDKAIAYFRQAGELAPQHSDVQAILKILQDYSRNQHNRPSTP